MYWYVSPSLRVYEIIHLCGLSDSDVLVFRYSAVCRPHAYRDSNITERTGTRVAKYVTPVIIFSAIYNIPKFLEYKVSRNIRKCSIYHSVKSSSALSYGRYLKYFPLSSHQHTTFLSIG